MLRKNIAPMLASPYDKCVIGDWSHFALEQKFDGIRLMVYVDRSDMTVRAHTRPRDKGTRFIDFDLPQHLAGELLRLPSGIYDGELLNGTISTDVKRKDLRDQMTFMVFDFLYDDHAAISLVGKTYDERRMALEYIFLRVKVDPRYVQLAPSMHVKSESEMVKVRNAIWKTGGEGIMLKRRSSVYHAGKRSKDWIKVKRVEHATLEVVGFKRTRGTVRNLGPFSIVLLRDAKGVTASCKVLNDEELDRINAAWTSRHRMKLDDVNEDMAARHPFVGRKLVIEYFGMTNDGNYRGPVLWDRWEDE